jgi:FlaA1/EpsC-like NDP-sugar epimerase
MVAQVKSGFKQLYKKVQDRILYYNTNYLKNWVVALIDVGVAAGCSGLVYVMYAPLDTAFGRLSLLYVFLMGLGAAAVAFYILKPYRIIIRYIDLKGLLHLGLGVALETVLLTLLMLWSHLLEKELFVRFLLVNGVVILAVLSGIRILMIVVYSFVNARYSPGSQRVLIYGVDDKAVALRMRFQKSANYRPVGFLTHDIARAKYRLNDLNVYHFHTQQDVRKIVDQLRASAVVFPTYKDIHHEKDRLIAFCEEEKIDLMMVPPVDEFRDTSKLRLQLRPIAIEDMLGRDEIHINMEAVAERFKGHTVLVTGAAGSIGGEFARQVAAMGVVKQLVLFDIAETPMHYLQMEIKDKYPDVACSYHLGDVRHAPTVHEVMSRYKPQIVFHAAAYKHVPLMEDNACEAVRVNVGGTRIMADAAVANGVKKFIFLSTDKAVNPTNVMGASKRLAEMYVQSLGLSLANGQKNGATQFVTTRFGNVLESNGSVIPYFRYQIKKGGPITVTHKDITRFFMSIGEACRLIMQAATLSADNEIMVFDMGEPMKIWDLAERMIRLAGFIPGVEIQMVEIGLRPGEKLYEEVLSSEENTLPTPHPHIRIAKVRSNDYENIKNYVDKVVASAGQMDVNGTVQLLKEIVPEYISQNSAFEVYD